MNFIIQLVVGVVLSLASTLLKQAFAEKPKSTTGTRGTAQIGGKVPQFFLMGTVADAGKHEYRNFWGHSGDVPNAYNVDVYSFGDLPITALTGLFVFGTAEPVASTGHVTQGYPTTGDKAGKLWIEFRDGTQTTTSSYLTAKFGGDADRPWQSDMIGRGVPQLLVTALWDEKVWTRFPEIVGEFQGIPLYDVTKDTTAGGSGAQRWADRSTWAFSDNNAVMIYNILRGIQYAGTRVWGGSCEAAQLPYDVWAAAISACNEGVPLVAGGTEKRFRAGRRVNLNERPADVITELLIGCNARISHASDGTVYILVGVPDEADGGFTDADVLATEALGSIPFPNLDGIVNGGTATYREPSQAWEDKETAPYLRSDLEAEDDGRQQLQGLDLGTTFSGTQAQRILKAVIEEGRRFRTHVVALPPEFARFHPLSVLAWTSDRFGYAAKLFLITARTRDPWGNVVFGLQEIDPADHDWVAGTDERPMSFAPVVINRPAPQPMTGWGAAPAYIPDNAGTPRRPSIEITYAAGLVDVRAIRAQVRLAGASAPVFDGETPYDPADLAPSALLYGIYISATEYEVRGKLVPFSGRDTLWSNQDDDGTEGPWLAVTTPDIPDVDIPPITPIMLGEELANQSAILMGNQQGSIPEQLAALRQLQELLAGALMDVSATAKERLDVLDVSTGGANAAVIRNEKAIVAEGEARASAIEEVLANVNNVIAGGYLRLDATVIEEGASAQISARVRASFDATFSTAAWIIKATADGAGGTTSQFGVYANDFLFFSPTGEIGVPGFSVDEDGTATMVAAKVGTITAGLLRDLADTYRFDIANGRLYRTDGKVEFDMKVGRLIFKKVA